MKRLPHPLDDRGLAVRPPDVQLECDPANCRFPEPFKDRQHVYHPRTEYKTATEKRFRNLGGNVIRMCRCMHERWDNAYDPPPKPSREVMLEAIAESATGHMAVVIPFPERPEPPEDIVA
jgi:phytoene dehydrogenase-like protein